MNDNQVEQTQQVSNGSDVNMIEVNTPNFFERHFLHILTIFGVGFLLFTFIFQIYLTPIYIVGRSMQPTINSQSLGASDLTQCDLIYYKSQKSFEKSDIVVIDAQDYLSEQTDPIIKRVIATAGDTLTFDIYKIDTVFLYAQDLQIYKCYYNILLNGQQLSEDYLAEQECFLEIKTDYLGQLQEPQEYKFLQHIYTTLYSANPLQYLSAGSVDITIENNSVFVCGDNRNNSTDSRYFGCIQTSDILGKAVIHIEYGTSFFVGLFKEIFN